MLSVLLFSVAAMASPSANSGSSQRRPRPPLHTMSTSHQRHSADPGQSEAMPSGDGFTDSNAIDPNANDPSESVHELKILHDKVVLGPRVALFLIDLQPLWYSQSKSAVRRHFPHLGSNVARLLKHARRTNTKTFESLER